MRFFFLWKELTMALSSLVSLFVPTGPLTMEFSKLRKIYMADRGKLKISLSDNQPWRKSDFCGVGKGDVITLMPFLSARLTLEIREELHLITKMLFKVTVMWKTVWEMLKAFPMVKGWLPLVALIKLGGSENLRVWSEISEKWGYEYRSPSLTHKFVLVFAVVRSKKRANWAIFRFRARSRAP